MAKSNATTTKNPHATTGRRATRSNKDDDDETTAVASAFAPEPGPSAATSNSKKRKVSNETAAEGVEKGDVVAQQPPRDKGIDHGARSCMIQLPERPNLFLVPDTWWMVDLHARPMPKQGATPLVKRCMRSLGWSEAKARRVLRAYRQFLRVKVATKDWNAEILSPSREVDRMWRQHVLDNANYAHDCRLLCDGHFVKYDPDGDLLDIEARQQRLEATRQALLECYGEDGGGGEVDQSATGPWKEVFEDATAESSDEEPPSAGTRSSGPAADNAEEVGNGDDDNDDDDDDGGAWVAIVVRTLTGSETHLRVRPDARMGGVFAEFARRWGVPDPRMFRFVYRGSVLDGDSDVTPRALGIQDGDRILAGSGARGC